VGDPKLAVSKPEALELLEQEKEEAIRQEVMAAVAKARSLQSDFLGLGDRLYRKDPGVWKQVKDGWSTAWLPQVEVDVNVTCELRHTGPIADPLNLTGENPNVGSQKSQ
jgi:hypothetical protein